MRCKIKALSLRRSDCVLLTGCKNLLKLLEFPALAAAYDDDVRMAASSFELSA
jgi:hypothetical protein